MRLFLNKKTTDILTENEIEKLYKLDQLYTDIYCKIFGKKYVFVLYCFNFFLFPNHCTNYYFCLIFVEQ